ncbi:hypothetical protein [Paracoccus yeei]|uniref:hypothetical protein n=1 Tax=Paracoccus yeei TaxID=147645 RepID=UPI003BF7B709
MSDMKISCGRGMEGRQVEAGLPQRPPEIQRLRRGKTVVFCIVPGTHKSKIMHVPKGVHPVPPPPLDGHFPIIVKQQARDMSPCLPGIEGKILAKTMAGQFPCSTIGNLTEYDITLSRPYQAYTHFFQPGLRLGKEDLAIADITRHNKIGDQFDSTLRNRRIK